MLKVPLCALVGWCIATTTTDAANATASPLLTEQTDSDALSEQTAPVRSRASQTKAEEAELSFLSPTELPQTPVLSPTPRLADVHPISPPARQRLRWGAGLRAQTIYTEGAWLELGADAVVYPWKHLGLGITALQGAAIGASECETIPTNPCGPYWRSVSPFLEARVLPNFWASPYIRSSLGLSWGYFGYFRDQSSAVALAMHSELGLDFHYGASVRLYVAHERFEGQKVSLGGLGGGLQLGLTL